jgi:hypothetical protein
MGVLCQNHDKRYACGLPRDFGECSRASAIRACERARDPVAAREKLAEKALFAQALLDAARVPEAMEARGQKSIASFFGQATNETSMLKKLNKVLFELLGSQR